jgi:hypothetical protein
MVSEGYKGTTSSRSLAAKVPWIIDLEVKSKSQGIVCFQIAL